MVVQEEKIWQWLAEIPDPEVPALNIIDLGIVRGFQMITPEEIEVTITPTYSGCPAMDILNTQIRMLLLSRGFKKINIRQQLSPSWTTQWMSEEGKRKLKEYGIAPPLNKAVNDTILFETDEVPCPKCASENTELISKFGATSCKAMCRCLDCKEPFEYFKCH